LADLSVEEPMLLTELDGFLTGLLVSPVTVPTDDWMTVIWGVASGGIPPFDDPLDVQWFVNAVSAGRDEIARNLSQGKLQPILDIDERDGEVFWEYWVDAFAEAIALRPDAWAVLTDDPERVEPWSRMIALIAIARDESDLDSIEFNAFQSRAVAELTDTIQRLYTAIAHHGGVKPLAAPANLASKIGRNDLCHCGSGKKHKHCCS
jgi:uncharacterized protein